MPTKLLMVADAGAPTGFEKVMRYVGKHLHQTGKYEITVRGLGYDAQNCRIDYPFEVKDWGGSIDDPAGVMNFGKWVKEDKPDVVWAIHDLWNLLGYCLHKPLDLPFVAYYPVDAPNMTYGNAWALGAVSEAVTYTQFGARESAAGLRMAIDVIADRVPEAALEPLEWIETTRLDRKFYGRLDRFARYQNPKNFNVIPHGLDVGIYEARDKQKCRQLLKLPESGFIILYVATNQFRKRQDLALRAFARHLKTHPDSWLVLHCAHDFGKGWDLAQLANLYGIRDRVLFTHQTLGELSEDDLCSLYNAADVNINTSGGEGWGLPIFESAVCGVPQLVPDWSATRELWSGVADLIRVADYRIEPRLGINVAHAVIDLENLVQWLDQYVRQPEIAASKGAAARAHALAQPKWDAVGAAFDQVIEHALLEPSAREYSLSKIKTLRDGDVHCEVANWL